MRATTRSLITIACSALMSACNILTSAHDHDAPETPAPSRAIVLDLINAFGESFTDDAIVGAAIARTPSDGGVLLNVGRSGVTDVMWTPTRCPLGGSISLRQTEPIRTTSSLLVFDMEHANCTARSRSGRAWTFDGDPNVQVRITGMSGNDISSTGGVQTFQLLGGFRYRSGGDTGRCAIDARLTLRYMVERNGTVTEAVTATGNICGVDVNETL